MDDRKEKKKFRNLTLQNGYVFIRVQYNFYYIMRIYIFIYYNIQV